MSTGRSIALHHAGLFTTLDIFQHIPFLTLNMGCRPQAFSDSVRMLFTEVSLAFIIIPNHLPYLAQASETSMSSRPDTVSFRRQSGYLIRQRLPTLTWGSQKPNPVQPDNLTCPRWYLSRVIYCPVPFIYCPALLYTRMT